MQEKLFSVTRNTGYMCNTPVGFVCRGESQTLIFTNLSGDKLGTSSILEGDKLKDILSVFFEVDESATLLAEPYDEEKEALKQYAVLPAISDLLKEDNFGEALELFKKFLMTEDDEFRDETAMRLLDSVFKDVTHPLWVKFSKEIR